MQVGFSVLPLSLVLIRNNRDYVMKSVAELYRLEQLLAVSAIAGSQNEVNNGLVRDY